MENFNNKTSLMEIRDFLAAHKCAPKPWENTDNVVDRLFESLCVKQGDKRFWADLKRLVGRLDDERFNTSAMKGSSVFGDASLDKLVEELRGSIGGGGGGNGVSGLRKWAASSVAVPAFLSFLLLGVSISCDNSDSNDADSDDSNTEYAGYDDDDDDVNNQTDEVCDEALEEGFSGYSARVYCDLIDIINESAISNDVKDDLLECLPELDSYSRESLLDLFDNMSDEQIADFLSFPQSLCHYYADPSDDDIDDDH